MGKKHKRYFEIEPESIALIVGVLGGVILPTGALGIDVTIGENRCKEYAEKLSIKEEELNQAINIKVDGNNISAANAKLTRVANDEYNLNIFGSQDKTTEQGDVVKEFVNLDFVITQENATKLEEAMKEKMNLDMYTLDISSNFGSSASVSISDEYELFTPRLLKKSYNVSNQMYNELISAVQNAYSYEVDVIYEASSMARELANEYRYVRPETLTYTDVHGPYTSSHVEFINAGLIITGISDVIKDEKENVSYFYVDTLQTINGVSFNQRKAKVKVAGVDYTTDEEVYKMFIEGKHLSFEEVASYKNKEDNINLVSTNSKYEDKERE